MSAKLPPGTWPAGKIFGIDIRLDWSWLIIVLVILFSLTGHLSRIQPGLDPSLYAVASFITAALFFASILIHELCHSLVARAFGVQVHGITLFVFGGVSWFKSELSRPLHEFLVAAVGPLSSALLGVLFFLLRDAFSAGPLISESLGWLGAVNVGLAVFNMIPGFPLDGGRSFRAIVWAVSGDAKKATRLAALVGTAVAYGLIASGLGLALAYDVFVNGLWLAVIGWFLLNAAKSSLAQMEISEVLARVLVGQAVRRDCVRVAPSESVAHLVKDHVLDSGQGRFLVSDNGSPEGVVTLHEVESLSREAWEDTQVNEIMVPVKDMPRVSTRETLLAAMQSMDREGIDQVSVDEGGTVVGMLTREDLMQAASRYLQFGSKR